MAQTSNSPSDLEKAFIAEETIPDALQALTLSLSPIDKAVKTAIVVFDTNSLLIPYCAGKDNLKLIVESLSALKKQKRIYIPKQVIREFVKNRANKIQELHKGLSDKISKIVPVDKLSYPILENLAEYKQINEKIAELNTAKEAILKINQLLMSKIRSWDWNDPVTIAYKNIFTVETIIDTTESRDKLLSDAQRRYSLSIPPGYKDAQKDDFGIGDYLIWKSILETGRKLKNDLIFISSDEKADWQIRSGGQGISPRHELIIEYSIASCGKSFYIVPLSKLLELLKVSTSLVEEIKQEEYRILESSSVVTQCPFCNTSIQCKLNINIGSSAQPTCLYCGNKFHIHRTKIGVAVRKPFERKVRMDSPSEDYLVQCPNCDNILLAPLAMHQNATSNCQCDSCAHIFTVAREGDGITYRESL